MVQALRDPLTGAGRDDVFVNAEDAATLSLRDGQSVIVRSAVGELRGKIKLMAIQPGNVQVHWPEGNPLIPRGISEPRSGTPDYNALVQLLPLATSSKSFRRADTQAARS